jgi:mannose-6-phosphate isomerase-like protein (cupin superfamily)
MSKLCIFRALGILFLAPLIGSSVLAQSVRSARELTIQQMLNNMAEAFRHKVHPNYSLAVQLNIKPALDSGYVDTSKPTVESWYVMTFPGKNVQVSRQPDGKLEIIFYTTEQALRLLSAGKYNPMTAILATRGSDPVFIRWERPKGIESTPQLRAKVREFIHFFDPSLPQRYVLEASHARVVHGSPAIGLYYYPGLRSAWYEVRKGARLNQPGDTNPFHQAFIFISGKGKAKLGDKTVEVKAGESYYIPPNSDHVVWTNSNKPLVLIWMAWGEGA